MNQQTPVRMLAMFLLATVVFFSCKKEDDNSNTNTTPAVSDEFNYETTVKAGIYFDVPDHLKNATFELYTADPEVGGELLTQGKFNTTGVFESSYIIPSSATEIYFRSTYVGLPGGFSIPVENGVIAYNFDKTRQFRNERSNKGNVPAPQSVNNVVYNFMGTYNNQGVPDYLLNPGDVIDQAFIDMVNASLPEGNSVPTSNPQYLASSNETNVILDDSADVWVTFVSEGAGFRNVLGYYAYDINNPPADPSQIDSIHLIFPNASFDGSGGGLFAGDKVYLGSFAGQTAIGWVLLQNAWQPSNQNVNLNANHFYSTTAWNPENDPNLKQHNVALYDNVRELALVGFEDQMRTNSDQDFNDCVFYATSNPIEAMAVGQLPPITQGGNDTDGDGVPDAQDDYPNDGSKAFDNFVPFENGYSSNAFEDLWPSQGDYDFNDLIVNYNFNHITNGTNELVELEWEFVVRHIGASFNNGFGIELPFPVAQVTNITGHNFTENLITLNGNGTEAGQTNAVVMVFDNAMDVLNDTITMSIQLSAPYNFSAFNQASWNPFIFVDGDRSHEVHLPNYGPTDLMNMSLFGTGQDDSDVVNGRFYKNTSNQPWAINVSHDYLAPVEKVRIENAYLRFDDWVNSNGTQYNDWYVDQPGYRNLTNIQN